MDALPDQFDHKVGDTCVSQDGMQSNNRYNDNEAKATGSGWSDKAAPIEKASYILQLSLLDYLDYQDLLALAVSCKAMYTIVEGYCKMELQNITKTHKIEDSHEYQTRLCDRSSPLSKGKKKKVESLFRKQKYSKKKGWLCDRLYRIACGARKNFRKCVTLSSSSKATAITGNLLREKNSHRYLLHATRSNHLYTLKLFPKKRVHTKYALSDDDNYLVVFGIPYMTSRSDGGGMYIYSQNGVREVTFSSSNFFEYSIRKVDIFDDWIVACTNARVHVLQAGTGEKVHSYAHTEYILCVVLWKEQRSIIFSDFHHRAHFFHVPTGVVTPMPEIPEKACVYMDAVLHDRWLLSLDRQLGRAYVINLLGRYSEPRVYDGYCASNMEVFTPLRDQVFASKSDSVVTITANEGGDLEYKTMLNLFTGLHGWLKNPRRRITTFRFADEKQNIFIERFPKGAPTHNMMVVRDEKVRRRLKMPQEDAMPWDREIQSNGKRLLITVDGSSMDEQLIEYGLVIAVYLPNDS